MCLGLWREIRADTIITAAIIITVISEEEEEEPSIFSSYATSELKQKAWRSQITAAKKAPWAGISYCGCPLGRLGYHPTFLAAVVTNLRIEQKVIRMEGP